MSPARTRTVVITGVTRGLGRAMVDEFSVLGHTVIGCGRTKAAIEQLSAAHGAPHRFDAVDVADDAQVAAWATSVLASSGPPDLLVNCAALINRNAPLWQVAAEEFAALMDVNVKGTANVIRHFVPAMVARGSGVIINFSSGWGRDTDAQVAPYCATKWAIEGLTRALAQELPRGMAAIPFSPGIIDTDMLRSCFGAEAARFPTPQRWARSAVPFMLALGAKQNGLPLTAP